MKVAVICGGPSVEAEVSRSSAAGVAAALRQADHEPVQLELDRALPDKLLAGEFEVAFPVTHGALGEDGCLQGLLEVLEVGYVGSGVRASAVAADKVATKIVYVAAGLPVAPQITVEVGQSVLLRDIRESLGPEVVVKPATGGSAISVSRLLDDATDEDLSQAVRTAHETSGVVLIERLVRGEELTCGVLETDQGPQALPPTQIQARAADFYDFRSKYAEGGSQHLCPAPIDAKIKNAVQQLAVRAHLALGARDLSRTDFILTSDRALVLLETNTLPGMTGVSLFPEAAGVAGIAFPDLVDRLVQRASGRFRARRRTPVGVALPERFA